mmetsp:Transcript_14812/g.45771  ORF Transcript_14812/g.45771 Transcript_14812/m.45771 type:complete len:204 (-) Transcript_14812:74-685(-)
MVHVICPPVRRRLTLPVRRQARRRRRRRRRRSRPRNRYGHGRRHNRDGRRRLDRDGRRRLDRDGLRVRHGRRPERRGPRPGGLLRVMIDIIHATVGRELLLPSRRQRAVLLREYRHRWRDVHLHRREIASHFFAPRRHRGARRLSPPRPRATRVCCSAAQRQHRARDELALRAQLCDAVGGLQAWCIVHPTAALMRAYAQQIR